MIPSDRSSQKNWDVLQPSPGQPIQRISVVDTVIKTPLLPELNTSAVVTTSAQVSADDAPAGGGGEGGAGGGGEGGVPASHATKWLRHSPVPV